LTGAGLPRWLVKSEPGAYSYADLARDGRTAWTGVKNAAAQIHLRTMAEGDVVLVYHTGTERAVVGRARVARAAYPDPSQGGRLACVDLVPLAPLQRSVTLREIRDEPRLAAFDLVRRSRLSVLPVPAAAARWILERAGA
jgi:predicted RNA-binding protein with PUA-like domain